MKFFIAAPLLLLSSLEDVIAQQKGTFETEGRPTITLKECTIADGCTSRQAELTLDANWRWIHSTSGSSNCYTGNQWSSQFCSDPVECAKNCALEGVSLQKYRETYGIKQVQDGVQLDFVTDHQYGTNVGSRVYGMDTDDTYQLFYLKNREFSFEVDVSGLQCGQNGAMYFSEMDKAGGLGLGDNNAGAAYGTGYCDAQCPHDMKFIAGEANVIDWTPNPNDLSNNMGAGKHGACCAEMDIWEANSMATAYTPHTCGIEGQLRCEGIDCGDNASNERYDGVCDKDGCDINPYRMGNTEFYGRGPQYDVDTTKTMTVVTQFLTTDGTDSGDLSEMRRFYVQDGNIIHSPPSTILGPNDTDSITDKFCDDKKDLFGDVKDFQEHGGMKGMGESLDRGHVMIFSLWDDVEVNMLWLDSAYPLNRPVTDPGIKRGDCSGGIESTPTYLRDTYPNASVTFKNAAVGEIGSTTGPVTPTTPSPNPPTTNPPPNPPPSSGPCGSGCCSQNFGDCISWCGTTESECLSCNQDVAWIDCPGQNCLTRWNDCTNDSDGCCDGLTCVSINPNYSQCRYVDNQDPPTPSPTDATTPSPTISPIAAPSSSSLPTKVPTTKAPTTAPGPDELFSCSNGAGQSTWASLLAMESITNRVSTSPNVLSVVSSGGAAGDGSYVVSESQAYGVLSASLALMSMEESDSNYEQAKLKFEGYFNGWRQMCRNSAPPPCQNPMYCDNGNAPCLPGWKHTADFSSVVGTGAAPDGDEDAIVGMIIALKAVELDSVKPPWYDEVSEWADQSCTQFLQDNTVLSPSTSHRLLKLGSCWGGWDLDGNNPSYHAPGHFRMMRDFQTSIQSRSYTLPPYVNSGSWNSLIDTSYKFLSTTQCQDTGLVPNWALVKEIDSQTLAKQDGSFSGSGTPQYEFGAEASRTMWRIAFDAAAYPEESAVQSGSFLRSLHMKLVENFNPSPTNGWEYFGENSLQACSPMVSNVFGSWQWNYFISAPVFSTLVGGINTDSFDGKDFDQQTMIDAACDRVSDTANQSYYPLSWQVIAQMTLNGEVAKAGALFQSTPTQSPQVSPTKVPTYAPTSDMCIPAGSNCFMKHKEGGCNDQSCEQKVCDEREKCCNKKWNDKCKNKAEELCTPCACDEDTDELFLLKMKESEPVTKTCKWLKDQSMEKRDSVCKKFHSFGGIQAARFVCPITCELEGCTGN